MCGVNMKPIPGFDNYCITKDGRVWSFPRRKSSKNGIWLKSFTHLSGHLSVCLYKNNKKSTKHIHRLVLETFVSKCPEGMECRHLDGNPANNSLDNLRWGTTKENMNDKIKHGKSNFGEKNNKHKLTDEKARMIIYICIKQVYFLYRK